jgi:NADH dehydrogenase
VILLAGGTGTLGGVLIRTLQDAGMPFRILTRSSQRGAALKAAGLDVAIGDVGNPADLTRALSGCTAVVSAISGFGPQSGSTPPAVDRDGNISLMEAAERAGVRQFVHFSMHGASASHPLELARMKFAAEQRLMAGNLEWTIVRPTTILETYTAIMGESLGKSGVAVVFGTGTNRSTSSAPWIWPARWCSPSGAG